MPTVKKLMKKYEGPDVAAVEPWIFEALEGKIAEFEAPDVRASP